MLPTGMRVAFSGAHRTGKTTTIEALAALLPAYEVVPEPYWALEEEGHAFEHPLGAEDFELQLKRSLEDLEKVAERALFDRCPLDFLAYLRAVDDGFDDDEWIDEVRAAMAKIDLLVFVPIEDPDLHPVNDVADRKLRRQVDKRLRELVLDDPYDLQIPTLEVEGSVEERMRQVRRAMQENGERGTARS